MTGIVCFRLSPTYLGKVGNTCMLQVGHGVRIPPSSEIGSPTGSTLASSMTRTGPSPTYLLFDRFESTQLDRNTWAIRLSSQLRSFAPLLPSKTAATPAHPMAMSLRFAGPKLTWLWLKYPDHPMLPKLRKSLGSHAIAHFHNKDPFLRSAAGYYVYLMMVRGGGMVVGLRGWCPKIWWAAQGPSSVRRLLPSIYQWGCVCPKCPFTIYMVTSRSVPCWVMLTLVPTVTWWRS